MEHLASRQMYQRALLSLAGGVSSQFRARSPHPLFYETGTEATITDIDGNIYLDFTLSQGPVLLGHRHQAVDAAIVKALERGILYAGQHDLEIAVAEWLQRYIPSAERVRFGSSGSEMVQAALRAARYITGKTKIMKFEGHYHGWFDNVAVSINPTEDMAGPHESPSAAPWTGGQVVPADVVVAPFNHTEIVGELIERHAGDLAAIILEPIACNNGCIPAEPNFLRFLRAECDRRGIVLIFDEIITGFRMGLGGAQQYYGVIPDLSIFGKGMGAGLPIATLVGKEAFMRPIAQGRATHAGTYNSNTVCLAAALATLQTIEKTESQVLFERGTALQEGLRMAASQAEVDMLVQGPGPMFHTSFTRQAAIREYRDLWHTDVTLLTQFINALHDEGVRVIGRGLWYVSYAHTDADIEHAVAVAGRVLKQLRNNAKGA